VRHTLTRLRTTVRSHIAVRITASSGSSVSGRRHRSTVTAITGCWLRMPSSGIRSTPPTRWAPSSIQPATLKGRMDCWIDNTSEL
jgi:hypothetical protein